MNGRCKRLTAALLLLAVVISLAACREEKKFGHAEITVGLNENFRDYDSEGAYDVAYTYGGMIVGILRLSHEACYKDGVPTTLSPRQFANYYRNRTDGLGVVGEIADYGDIPYFTYTLKGKDGVDYTYMPTFYVSQYAYFVITFITPTADYGELLDDIEYYLDTVRIEYS